MKAIIIFFALTILVSCAPNTAKLMDIKPGMTKADLIQELGTPTTIAIVSHWYLLTYNFYSAAYPLGNEYAFYFNGKDELIDFSPMSAPARVTSTGLAVGFN